MLLCTNEESLSTFSDIANIVIAAVGFFLAGYIFIYQRRKDKRDEASNLLLQEQNIKLQWFKDLIIEPHLPSVFNFYDKLFSISETLSSLGLTNDEKITVSDNIKAEHSKLRKSFVDAVRSVDAKLG